MSELIGFGLLFILLAGACFFIYVAATGYYYQILRGQQLKEDLGFEDGAAYLRVGRRTHSALCLEEVTPDGVFHKAGLRSGNVLPRVSHTDLFRYLHRNRGKKIELVIVDGGPGPPFYERMHRTIEILVPAQSE